MRTLYRVPIIKDTPRQGKKTIDYIWFSELELVKEFVINFNSLNIDLPRDRPSLHADIPIAIEIPEDKDVISTWESMQSLLPRKVTIDMTNTNISD